MRFVIHLKFWFFAHYWWLIGLAVVGATALLVHLAEPISSFATAIGALLSIVYFVQKQRLEELRLFRDIFKECNTRYDGMNDSLARVCEVNDARLTPEEAALLIDYFNLCGEEYLYYRQGYIPPAVWEAWHLGMQIVISSPRINDLWRAEASTGSYYGLPLKPFNYPQPTARDA
jgi:hypothetical protein